MADRRKQLELDAALALANLEAKLADTQMREAVGVRQTGASRTALRIREVSEDKVSSVNDFWQTLRSIPRQVVNDRDDAMFAAGFVEAVDVCMNSFSKNIDGLFGQISSGNDLSPKEQFLLARLTEMKSELEAELRDSWEGTATGEASL